MKKLIVMLLLIGTMSMLLAACVDPDIGAEQPDATTAAVEETTEKTILDNVPEDLKYKGEMIKELLKLLDLLIVQTVD